MLLWHTCMRQLSYWSRATCLCPMALLRRGASAAAWST